MSAGFYDELYSALAVSRTYRRIVTQSCNLPEGVIPLSALTGDMLRRIAGEIDVGRGCTVLDVACGLGTTAMWLSKTTGAAVTGIDFAPSAIQAANAVATQRGLKNVTFVVADATATGLPERSFDAAICIDSLQFIDPVAAMSEIARVLKPRGVVVCTTWETLQDVDLPTMVADYRPIFEEAGLRVDKHEVVNDARDTEAVYYRAILGEAEPLRQEMGACADAILEEAETIIARSTAPPRVRKVLIVAEKRVVDAPPPR